MRVGPLGREPEPAAAELPKFTAWAECPACGRHECHAMRPPRPAPTAEELAAWQRDHTTQEVRAFGRLGAVAVRHCPPPPVDESTAEVIRICRCGHEWGMR